MGAHGSKEKLSRSSSERFVHTQVIERERFGSFGKRAKGILYSFFYYNFFGNYENIFYYVICLYIPIVLLFLYFLSSI